MSAFVDSAAQRELPGASGASRWRTVHVIIALVLALAVNLTLSSRFLTAQARQAPPDRITLRSPDGRSQVVIAVSDNGFLHITLAPTDSRRQPRLPNPVSLRLVGGPHPSLELRGRDDELVAFLGGPRFRHTEP